MKFVLIGLTALSLLIGFAILALSKSALQEIEGFILILIGAVTLGAACIVEAIEQKK